MPMPVVYGASYSVYVQAVRLTLWAKTVPYACVEVDVWTEGRSPEHLLRHPFGRIPAFEHDHVRLYETAPICCYIDEAFTGAPRQPSSPLPRAVMGQAISIMDNYAYRSLVWGIYFERIEAPRRGRAPDVKRVEAGRKQGATCLRALDGLAPTGSWLAGDNPSLADFHAAPMFNLFMQAPDAAELMQPHSRLREWWARVDHHISPAQIV